MTAERECRVKARIHTRVHYHVLLIIAVIGLKNRDPNMTHGSLKASIVVLKGVQFLLCSYEEEFYWLE
jgi:hypothetical protein